MREKQEEDMCNQQKVEEVGGLKEGRKDWMEIVKSYGSFQKDGHINFQKLDQFILTHIQPKCPTKPNPQTNFCNKQLPPNHKTYRCLTCSILNTHQKNPQHFITFCQQCFILDRHADHQYYQYKQQGEGEEGGERGEGGEGEVVYCQCGCSGEVQGRLCDLHGDWLQIQEEVGEMEKEIFLGVFRGVVDGIGEGDAGDWDEEDEGQGEYQYWEKKLYEQEVERKGEGEDEGVEQEEGHQQPDNQQGQGQSKITSKKKKFSQLDKLSIKLLSLSIQNNYYRQLITHFLTSPTNPTNSSTSPSLPYLHLFLTNSSPPTKSLLHNLSKSLRCRKQLLKKINSIYIHQNLTQNIKNVNLALLTDFKTLEGLARDGYFLCGFFQQGYQIMAGFRVRELGGIGGDRVVALQGKYRIYQLVQKINLLLHNQQITLQQIHHHQHIQQEPTKHSLQNSCKKVVQNLLHPSPTQNKKNKKQLLKFLIEFFNQKWEYEEGLLTCELAEFMLVLFLACYPCQEEMKVYMKEQEEGEEGEEEQQKEEEGEVKKKEQVKQGQDKQTQNNEKDKEKDQEKEQKQLQNNTQKLDQTKIFQSYQQQTQSMDDLPSFVVEANRIMLKLLTVATGGDYRRICGTGNGNGEGERERDRGYMEEVIERYEAGEGNKGTLMARLKDYFYFVSLHTKSICFYQQKPNNRRQFLILILTLIQIYQHNPSPPSANAPTLPQIIQRIWKSLLNWVSTHIYNVVNQILLVLRLLLKVDSIMVAYKGQLGRKFCKGWDLGEMGKEEVEEELEDQKYKEKWFYEVLRGLGEVNQITLIDMNVKGYLNFGKQGSKQNPTPSQILKTQCTYNKQTSSFSLNPNPNSSPPNFNLPDYILNFPVSTVYDYSCFYTSPPQYHYTTQSLRPSQQHKWVIGPMCLKLMKYFLNSGCILESLGYYWEMYRMRREKVRERERVGQEEEEMDMDMEMDMEMEDEKVEKCGFLYLYALVQIDKIRDIVGYYGEQYQNKAENIMLKQKLNELRNHPEQLQIYADKQGQLQLIKKLLNITLPQDLLHLKQKFLKKREHLLQKYQKNQNKALSPQPQPLPSSQQQQNLQQSQTCMICHEQSKIENQLVYLGSLRKGDTIGCVVHGRDDVVGVLLRVCFHALHVDCYKKLAANSVPNLLQNLKCPLCNKPSQFMIPKSPKTPSSPTPKTLKTCSSILTASLIHNHQVYSYQNFATLYFLHLVQALGLQALTRICVDGEKGEGKEIGEVGEVGEKEGWGTVEKFVYEGLRGCWMGMGDMERKEFLGDVQEVIQRIDKECQNLACKIVQKLVIQSLLYSLNNHSQTTHIKNLQTLSTNLTKILQPSQTHILHRNIQKILGFQLPLDQQQIKKKQGKVSLKLEMCYLPEKAEEVRMAILRSNCLICHKKIMQVYYNPKSQNNDDDNPTPKSPQLCLLCNTVQCQSCQCPQIPAHNHSLNHNGNKISLNLQNLKVTLSRKNPSIITSLQDEHQHQQEYIRLNLYYNCFMVPYCERNRSQGVRFEEYCIWRDGLEKGVREFFQ